jgi:hypothetical protein
VIQKTTISEKPQPRRPGTFRQELYLVLAGLLFSLVVCEIFLRLIGYSYPIFYATDYYRGYSLRPGIEGHYQREGESYVRINSDGQRDRERQKVWDYSPDIVLLAFTTYNDIYDNSRALSKTPDVPFFTYRNGELVCDDSFRDSSAYQWSGSKLSRLGRWFHDHLRLVQLVHYAQFAGKMRLTEWRNQKRAAATPSLQTSPVAPRAAPTAHEIGLDNMIYIQPRDDDWKEAWHVTEGLIRQMRDDVDQKGARFIVVILSNAIQVYPDPIVRENFMKRIGVSTVFYPNLRLRDFAQRQQIDFLDLAEPMQLIADQNRVFLHGFGRDIDWNANGHRLAAELIAHKFCQPK